MDIYILLIYIIYDYIIYIYHIWVCLQMGNIIHNMFSWQLWQAKKKGIARGTSTSAAGCNPQNPVFLVIRFPTQLARVKKFHSPGVGNTATWLRFRTLIPGTTTSTNSMHSPNSKIIWWKSLIYPRSTSTLLNSWLLKAQNTKFWTTKLHRFTGPVEPGKIQPVAISHLDSPASSELRVVPAWRQSQRDFTGWLPVVGWMSPNERRKLGFY